MRRERSPHVTERSAGTHPAGAAAPSPDLVKQWQSEIERNIRRVRNLADLLANPREPKTGQTSRQEVFCKNKARLYRYAGRRTRSTPLLFVPNLGISRPYIFDLAPGASFIEYMTTEGFDFYLLDWGIFGPEDRNLTFEECVSQVLPEVTERVLRCSNAPELSVLGYCMGAPLAASFLGAFPESPVRNFINMAGPIDFSRSGLFARWLDARYFDADRFVDVLAADVGAIPADVVRAGFTLVRPTMALSTSANLWWNLWNEKYVEGFIALNKWANEYVAFPAEFFRQWVRDFYQGNKLYGNELEYGGRRVRLGAISCPVLVVGAREDYIAPPPCVRALMDVVGSRDKEYVELPGGHISLIAGRGALKLCWPKISEWLAARSAAGRSRHARRRQQA